MASPLRRVCKRVETDSGEPLFLLIDWRSEDTFDIEVMDCVHSWRAAQVGCPATPSVGAATWIQKAQEAFGFVDTQTPFEFGSAVEASTRELRWFWPAENPATRNVGRLTLGQALFSETLEKFLNAACELSHLLSVVTVENNEAQRIIKNDFVSIGQEVEKATLDRKILYKKCTALFNAQKREIDERDQTIRSLRAKLEERGDEEDRFSDATS